MPVVAKALDKEGAHYSAPSAYEEIATKVRLYIEANQFNPGDVLPAERGLAQKFKVSRHTLREALRVLEERGVLVTKRGSGTYIAPKTHAGLRQVLASCVATERDQLEEIFQFREILEPQVVGLAAQMATPAHIEELESLIEQQAEEDDISKMKEIDTRFHMVLAQATGNGILADLVERINNVLTLARSEHLISSERQQVSLTGHQNLVDAIRQKDSKKAQNAMRQHLEEIRGIILK